VLRTAPAVFAVGDYYQIMAPVEGETLFWVQVGTDKYHDASNGIMNSLSHVHRVTIPMQVLDAAKSYTVFIKSVVERKPYFPETGETLVYSYDFSPVPEQDIRAYCIADTHSLVTEPVQAAAQYGKIDLLILNGDIIDHSGEPEDFLNIYRICEALTGGRIPVVFARGNHDMRGRYAERFADYIPNQNGNTYYSFRLGSIWGVILDCGEDKADEHPEYGFTVVCHSFRGQQSVFLNQLIAKAEAEYAAPGVKVRLVICHMPFTQRDSAPFDIEEAIYREWAFLLRESIKPDLMLCAHTHAAEIRYPGCDADHYGQPCPVVIEAEYNGKDHWAGCGICFREQAAEVIFTDSVGWTRTAASVSYGANGKEAR